MLYRLFFVLNFVVFCTLECGSSSKFTITNLIMDITLDLLGFPTSTRNSMVMPTTSTSICLVKS